MPHIHQYQYPTNRLSGESDRGKKNFCRILCTLQALGKLRNSVVMFIFSGPFISLYFNVLALSSSYHLNGIEHSSFKNFSYTAKLVVFAQSEEVALALSIPSCRHNSITNRLIKRSQIRKKRCRESIMTFCRGIVGKSGMLEQLYLCLPLFRDCDKWDISSSVLAPFVISVIDQTYSILWCSFEGYLHQIHE